jgi:hypothetical protein
MKRRLSFIVLTVEILAITLMHAVKLSHSENNNKEITSHIIAKQPDFHLKQTYTAVSYLK